MKIKSLIGKRIAVHCTTEMEANSFLEMCDKSGIKWYYGDDLIVTNNWNKNKTRTCYYIGKDGLHYNSIDWCRDFYYKIITFNKFLTKLQGKRTYCGSFESKTETTIDNINNEESKDVMSIEDVEYIAAWIRLGYDYKQACQLVQASKIIYSLDPKNIVV